MPAVQTNYFDSVEGAYAGQIVNTEPNNLISRVAEEAIPYGQAVKQGTADNGVGEADNVSDVVRGIAVRDISNVSDENETYVAGQHVLVMDRGVIWVNVGAGGANAGEPAFVIPASGLFTVTSSSNLAIPNAVFDSSATDGNLAKLRLK